MFVTASSVGYGEVLVGTHAGRFVAGLTGTVGVVLACVLTGSLSSILAWTKGHLQALCQLHLY